MPVLVALPIQPLHEGWRDCKLACGSCDKCLTVCIFLSLFARSALCSITLMADCQHTVLYPLVLGHLQVAHLTSAHIFLRMVPLSVLVMTSVALDVCWLGQLHS